MPWRGVEPMDEKIGFISDYLSRAFCFSELCERYEMSRKAGYKWVEQDNEEGFKYKYIILPNAQKYTLALALSDKWLILPVNSL